MGRVRPIVELDIAAEVSGEIISLSVEEGRIVKTGDTLVKIKQDAYIAAVESAEASLGMARAEYARQELEMEKAGKAKERAECLHEGKSIPDSEYEDAVTAFSIAMESLKSAEYAVRRAEASLSEAGESLARTVILAPMSGTVSTLYVKAGERIVGTSQMAGTPLMKIADMARMEIVADASESDIPSLKPGDSASIRIDALNGARFDGKVTYIANSSKNIAGSFGQVANFETRIAILQDQADSRSPQHRIRPGMSATATIATRQVRGILTIPAQAVFSRNGKSMVWKTGRDGRVQSAAIQTGIQDFDLVEAVSGLKEGDRIVCSPYSAVTKTLSDGSLTRVMDK